MEFGEWMREVDDILLARVGVTSADLPDQCYRDLYDEGISPGEAAREALSVDAY